MKEEFKKQWGEAKQADTVRPFNCPECGKFCSSWHEAGMLDKEESMFVAAPDPHYTWMELHKCEDCETIYTIVNGS